MFPEKTSITKFTERENRCFFQHPVHIRLVRVFDFELPLRVYLGKLDRVEQCEVKNIMTSADIYQVRNSRCGGSGRYPSVPSQIGISLTR